MSDVPETAAQLRARLARDQEILAELERREAEELARKEREAEELRKRVEAEERRKREEEAKRKREEEAAEKRREAMRKSMQEQSEKYEADKAKKLARDQERERKKVEEMHKRSSEAPERRGRRTRSPNAEAGGSKAAGKKRARSKEDEDDEGKDDEGVVGKADPERGRCSSCTARGYQCTWTKKKSCLPCQKGHYGCDMGGKVGGKEKTKRVAKKVKVGSGKPEKVNENADDGRESVESEEQRLPDRLDWKTMARASLDGADAQERIAVTLEKIWDAQERQIMIQSQGLQYINHFLVWQRKFMEHVGENIYRSTLVWADIFNTLPGRGGPSVPPGMPAFGADLLHGIHRNETGNAGTTVGNSENGGNGGEDRQDEMDVLEQVGGETETGQSEETQTLQ
jgi:hypothetical protein